MDETDDVLWNGSEGDGDVWSECEEDGDSDRLIKIDRIPHASFIKCMKSVVQYFLADVLFLWGRLGLESFCIRLNTVYIMEVAVERIT